MILNCPGQVFRDLGHLERPKFVNIHYNAYKDILISNFVTVFHIKCVMLEIFFFYISLVGTILVQVTQSDTMCPNCLCYLEKIS